MNSGMIGDIIQRQAKTSYLGHAEESNHASWQIPDVDGKDSIEKLGRRPVAFQNENPDLRKVRFASHMPDSDRLVS
jgi:hypothetical protein